MSKLDSIKKFHNIEKDEDFFSISSVPDESKYPYSNNLVREIEIFDRNNNINSYIDAIEDLDIKNNIESMVNELDSIKDDSKKLISEYEEYIETAVVWGMNWKEIAMDLFNHVLEKGDIHELEKDVYIRFDLNSKEIKNLIKSDNSINKFNL